MLRREKEDPLIRARMVAGNTLIFLLGLFTLKVVAGYITNSVALLADAFNSLSDTLMIVAIFLALRVMTKKPNGVFPYGYFKLEDVITLLMSIGFIVLSISIIVRGIDIIMTGYYATKDFEVAAMVEIVAGVLSFFFAMRQKRVARKANIISLELSARDLQIDTVAAFFVAINIILNNYYNFPFEGYATVIVGILVITTAYRGAKSSLKNLLDVWDRPELIARIRDIINKYPPLKAGPIRLRRAGPFILGDAVVYAPEEMRLEDIDDIVEAIEEEIYSIIPDMYDLVINVEPLEEPKIICAIPVVGGDERSRIPDKFEDADSFIIMAVDPKRKTAEYVGTMDNIFKRRRNPEVKICKALVGYNVDCIIARDLEETSFELFKAYSVDTYITRKRYMDEAIQEFIDDKLKIVEDYESIHRLDTKCGGNIESDIKTISTEIQQPEEAMSEDRVSGLEE